MKQTETLEMESWPIENLIPYARNARSHSPEQIAQIAASIAEFGFNNPVLTDPEGGIIAGHGRVLAARKLGIGNVPVVVLGHLNENRKRAFMLADNKLALNAGWDEQMLRLELEALSTEDFELALTGFGELELEQLFSGAGQGGIGDPDEAPAAESVAVTRPGEMWSMGPHRVLCGDATLPQELARVLGGRQCDLVFTDLPYNVDYRGKTASRMKIANDNLGTEFGAFLHAACRAMLGVSRGPLYLCMSSGELHQLHAAFTAAGGHWSTFVVWAKPQFTLGRSDYQRQYEAILYGWPEGSRHYWCGDRDQGDVWTIAKPRRNDLHPTMKPVELVERAIGNSSRKGNVVLDGFAGSGSTVIACENTERRARVIELEPRYVDVIVKRWQTYTGREALLEGDGRSFEAVARERLGEAAGGNNAGWVEDGLDGDDRACGREGMEAGGRDGATAI